MQPASILMVLTEFPPRIGGMQTHADALVRGLKARRHSINVATYRLTTETERAAAERYDDELGVPVHRRLSRISHFVSLERLEQLARDVQPDLIYCSTVFFGELQHRLNIPVVARSVGNDVLRPWVVYPFRPFAALVGAAWFEDAVYDWFQRLETPDVLEAFLKAHRRRVMIEAARHLSQVLANSEFTREALREIGVSQALVQVVPGGVDVARFSGAERNSASLRCRLGLPETAYVVMTACRLEQKKGVDFLIDAFAHIAASMPDAHLVIVGSGRRERRLRKQAAASPVASHIHFAGAVAQREIEGFYHLADAFVLASRIEVSRIGGFRDAETMGRVLCEANAAGVAVVASDSGGIPSVIRHGDNGLLFESDDAASLCGQLNRLRASPALHAHLVARGRRRAKLEFDWTIVVDAHVLCFERVLAAWPGTTYVEPQPGGVHKLTANA